MNRNAKYLALVRRELQEHRSLWLAPVVIAGLFLLTLVFGRLRYGPGGSFMVNPSVNLAEQADGAAMVLIGTGVFLNVVAGLVVFAYLLDCLFAERKDRSILFWKSLPVSDTETVLAKLVVASVIVPLGMMLLALLLQPLMALIAWIRYESLREVITLRAIAGWPEGLLRLGLSWLFGMLWYLPVAAGLMLASVLARRAPIVYFVMPLLVLTMFEKLVLEGDRIGRFIYQRLFPWDRTADILLNVHSRGGHGWWEPFQAPALWIGVAVGAGMLYTVIRLRRYRDDT